MPYHGTLTLTSSKIRRMIHGRIAQHQPVEGGAAGLHSMTPSSRTSNGLAQIGEQNKLYLQEDNIDLVHTAVFGIYTCRSVQIPGFAAGDVFFHHETKPLLCWTV